MASILTIEPELRGRITTILEANRSYASRVSMWEDEARDIFLNSFTQEELERLELEWWFWGRPKQLAPGPDCPCCGGQWLTWLILAGRGWGKTKTGAEWVHSTINDGTYKRFHLVAATAADARDIMVEGPAGIMASAKPWNKTTYHPTKRQVSWENGAVALIFSAEEPDRLRGEQCEAAWCDELAAWNYPETYSQLQFGLRLGKFPRTVITTTPRPTATVKEIAVAPTTHVTKGITYENFDHLAPAFIAEIIRVYEGTRWGQQEIYAEILDDAPGALWTSELIESTRIKKEEQPIASRFKKMVVAIDPATTVSEESSETGIVIAGLTHDDHAYVLQDASGRMKSGEWARRAIALYDAWECDHIVAEVNQGGDMVEHTINVYRPEIKVVQVRATRGKELRAEPVSAAYEKGHVHHVGRFELLEAQMTGWEPGTDEKSPDRLDALVWAMTDLVVGWRDVPLINMMKNDLVTAGGSYWTDHTRAYDDYDDMVDEDAGPWRPLR